MKQKNYYDILGIKFDASVEEIKKAYRVLAKKYHPDISADNDSRNFNLINEAYKILTDPYERLLYNYEFAKTLSVDEKPEKPRRKFKIIYSRSIGILAKRGFLSPRLPRSIRRKADIKHDLVLLIEDKNIIGTNLEFTVDVPTKVLCPSCRSTDTFCRLCGGKGYIVRPQKIKIGIPPGIKNKEIFEVDLSKIKQKNLMTIRAQKLRIKVVIK